MNRKTLWVVIALVIATIGASAVLSHFDWFKRNEHVALWLEGIALILIFAWDRLDAQAEHKETLAQIEIAKQQSQFVINSERAWLTADLGWPDSEGNIQFLERRVSSDPTTKTTAVALILKLSNDGRTPAWIEGIFAGMEIVDHEKQPEMSVMESIEALGSEKSRKVELTLLCPGIPKMGDEILRVHITLTYRDIFESREMKLEYFIEPLTNIIKKLELRKIDLRSPATWYGKN